MTTPATPEPAPAAAPETPAVPAPSPAPAPPQAAEAKPADPKPAEAKPEPKERRPNPFAVAAGQRAAEVRGAEVAELRAKAGEADALRATLARYADAALAELPEQARKAVLETAGDDPARRVDAVALLRKAGALGLPAPATTGGAAPAAPTPDPLAADPDVAAARRYAELAKRQPTLAADFIARNRAAIAAGQRKLPH